MHMYVDELAEDGRLERVRNKRRFIKTMAIVAVLVVIPAMTAALLNLAVKQAIPARHVVATSSDCAGYTRLAAKEGAPSPSYQLKDKYCEIANYSQFVEDATSYNKKRSIPVVAIAAALMAFLVWKIARAKF